MRLMRARMTRGTAVVMCVTSRSVRSVASHRRPGGCIRQPDHRQKLLMLKSVAVHAPDQRKRVPAHHDRERTGGNRLVEAAGASWTGTACHLTGCADYTVRPIRSEPR
jgi:hypothetical protein